MSRLKRIRKIWFSNLPQRFFTESYKRFTFKAQTFVIRKSPLKFPGKYARFLQENQSSDFIHQHEETHKFTNHSTYIQNVFGIIKFLKENMTIKNIFMALCFPPKIKIDLFLFVQMCKKKLLLRLLTYLLTVSNSNTNIHLDKKRNIYKAIKVQR